MSVQRNYCEAIARELRRHAVWQPGEALVLGDYGTVEGASFRRLGHISEFIDAGSLDVRTSSTSALEFTSDGTRVAMLTGEGAAEPIRAHATLKIGFGRENSIYLRASGVETQEIANLRLVTEAVRQFPDWRFDWVILANLTTADRASIILSVSANTEVSVLADVQALQEFNLGRAKVSTGLTFLGEAGFKMIGIEGPILFDLIRLRRFLGGTRRAAVPGGLALLPYEPVPPQVGEEHQLPPPNVLK